MDFRIQIFGMQLTLDNKYSIYFIVIFQEREKKFSN